MNRLSKYMIIAFSLLLCMLIGSLLAAQFGPETKTNEPVPIENALELYIAATEPLLAGDLELTLRGSTVTTISGCDYTEEITYKLQYDKGSNCHHTQAERTMGSHRITIDKYYMNGTDYQIVSGIPFCRDAGHYNESDLLKQFPSPMLDHKLYGKITGFATEDGYRIEFSDAIKLEDWVTAEFVQPQYANGTVLLSKDNRLISYSYTAAFDYNSQHYEVDYQITPMSSSVEITLPQLSWITTTAPEGAMLLEQSVGFLLEADTISATYQEEIYFEALGDRWTRNISAEVDRRDGFSATMNSDTTTTNDSRLDQSVRNTKEETYADGVYTVTKDNATEVYDLPTETDAMAAYWNTQLVTTIMLPEYIENCTIELNDNTICYNFTGNQAFAAFLLRNAGEQLYQNSELLINENDTFKAEQLTCYLELDKNTLLPTSSGISYTESYEIEGLPYRFIYTADQTYQFGAK